MGGASGGNDAWALISRLVSMAILLSPVAWAAVQGSGLPENPR